MRELLELKQIIEKELLLLPFERLASQNFILEGISLNSVEGFSHAGVEGIGFGYSTMGGEIIDRIEIETSSIKYNYMVAEFARKRYNLKEPFLKTIATGKMWAYSTIQPGDAIGHYGCNCVGTLGGIVYDSNENFYLLSNNHVIANVNNAVTGDKIFFYTQQTKVSPYRWLKAGTVGYLEKFIPLSANTPNLVDAAVGTFLPSLSIDNRIKIVGKLNGYRLIRVGVKVRKFGISSKYTEGIIYDVSRTRKIWLNGSPYIFTGQIMIKSANRDSYPFSIPGDSGSLIIDEENYAVGLLFAGNRFYTLANPIDEVLTALEVQL